MDVSSPERIMFPEMGITKAEMVAYYELVAEAFFPFLEGRPLTLERYPKGVHEKGFMQKNAGSHFPASIERHVVAKGDGGETRYPVVTSPSDIPYLANQGTVSFHIWTSRVESVMYPDLLVIDLDPEDGDVDRARSAAFAAGELLGSHGLESIPVATGSKGFHVWAPILPNRHWERVSLAARALAGLLVEQLPEAATLEFLKRNRKGRVFVDWLRNHPGASVVAPLSLRPRSRATISMPVTWDELTNVQPDSWDLRSVDDRLGHLPVWPEPNALPDEQLEVAAREAGVDLDSQFDRFGRDV